MISHAVLRNSDASRRELAEAAAPLTDAERAELKTPLHRRAPPKTLIRKTLLAATA